MQFNQTINLVQTASLLHWSIVQFPEVSASTPSLIRLEKNRTTLCRAREREWEETEIYDISHPTIYSEYSMRVVTVNGWHMTLFVSVIRSWFLISDATMIHWNGTYEIRFQPREFDGPNKSGRSSIRSADQEHENNWWTRLVSDTVEGEMNNCLDRPKQSAYG